jgi:hypothetical protein
MGRMESDPHGWSRPYRPIIVALLAAAALMTDYVLNVAVDVLAGMLHCRPMRVASSAIILAA